MLFKVKVGRGRDEGTTVFFVVEGWFYPLPEDCARNTKLSEANICLCRSRVAMRFVNCLQGMF